MPYIGLFLEADTYKSTQQNTIQIRALNNKCFSYYFVDVMNSHITSYFPGSWSPH